MLNQTHTEKQMRAAALRHRIYFFLALNLRTLNLYALASFRQEYSLHTPKQRVGGIPLDYRLYTWCILERVPLMLRWGKWGPFDDVMWDLLIT